MIQLAAILFAAPAFRFSVIASVCCFTSQMLGLIALPFYLQHTLGMRAVEADST
ncbi:MAG: hypothetical protein J0H84_09755 [Rhizobiales bacterium]|nr:hypothetical protein [Hyphomicrobiales bacterium]